MEATIPAAPTMDTTSISPKLPQELLDEITHAFASTTEDYKALFDLALASRSFRPLCQKYIFEKIDLSRSNPLDRSHTPPYLPLGPGLDILGTRLHKCLQTSPHLFSNVRALKMHAWSEAEFEWMNERGEELASIIRACTRLHTLEVASQLYCDWQTMNIALQSTLISLIMSSQLSHLTLKRMIEVPPELFNFFGSLKTLRLDEVQHGPQNFLLCGNGNIPASSVIEGNRSSLESLSLALPLSTFKHTSQSVEHDLSQLLLLDVTYAIQDDDENGYEHYIPLHKLLQQVNNIQHLHLNVIALDFEASGLGTIDITHIKDLRSLSFFVDGDLSNVAEYTSLAKNLIAASPALETATVMVSLWDRNVWYVCAAIGRWEDFQPSPHLRHLTLRFFMARDGEPGNTDYRGDGIRDALSLGTAGKRVLSLIREGRIRVVYDICHRHEWHIFDQEVMALRAQAVHGSKEEVGGHRWVP